MNKLIIQRNQDVGGTQTGIQGLTHELTLLHPDWILRLKTKRTVYKCGVSFLSFFFFFFLPVLGNLHDLNSSTRDWTQALGSESLKAWSLNHGATREFPHWFFVFFFKIVFTYLFLSVLDLCCCAWVFSSCVSRASHCSGFSCGLPLWLKQLRVCLPCRRPRFNPWVRKIPLEKGMTIHSSILAWRIPWIEEPVRILTWGRKESNMTERLSLSLVVAYGL